jgi:hypothetical protein
MALVGWEHFLRVAWYFLPVTMLWSSLTCVLISDIIVTYCTVLIKKEGLWQDRRDELFTDSYKTETMLEEEDK